MIQSRLNSWKVKFTSQVEKKVLPKAVTEAIPTYTISVFKMLKSPC